MFRLISKVIVAALISACLLPAMATSWPPPVTIGASSPSGQWVVRIVPGDRLDNVYGQSEISIGKYAKAIFYQLDVHGNYLRYLQADLLNPVAPLRAYLSDEGRLITVDNHYVEGKGFAVAIYGENGELLKQYRLADLYSVDQLQKIGGTVFSVPWRCPDKAPVMNRGVELSIYDALGGVLSINSRTADFHYRENTHKCLSGFRWRDEN